MLDNYGTHKTELIRCWLLRHPRFQVHYTPTYSSWLNQIERWFAALTEKQIRRGTHRSTRELDDAIRLYLKVHNQKAKPFVWVKTADQILANIARFSSEPRMDPPRGIDVRPRVQIPGPDRARHTVRYLVHPHRQWSRSRPSFGSGRGSTCLRTPPTSRGAWRITRGAVMNLSKSQKEKKGMLQTNTISIMVLDQDEASDFYVNKLGLELANGIRKGPYRWLTVRSPGDPNIEIFLEKPGPPLHDEATAAQLTAKESMRFVFRTDDCRKLYETFKPRGVTDFIQEPTEHEYGVDMRIREPFGNRPGSCSRELRQFPSRYTVLMEIRLRMRFGRSSFLRV